MILKPAPVSTRQVHYDRAQRMFLGEISDTRGFGRVYDDACDEGLTLVGTTGEVVFVIVREHRDADGDVTRWDLESVTRLNRAQPTYRMVLFND